MWVDSFWELFRVCGERAFSDEAAQRETGCICFVGVGWGGPWHTPDECEDADGPSVKIQLGEEGGCDQRKQSARPSSGDFQGNVDARDDLFAAPPVLDTLKSILALSFKGNLDHGGGRQEWPT